MISLINKNPFYIYNNSVRKMIKNNGKYKINLNLIFSVINDFKRDNEIFYYYPNHYNMYNLMFNTFYFTANRDSIIDNGKDIVINASVFVQDKYTSLRNIITYSMVNDKIINYPTFIFDTNLMKEYNDISVAYYKIYDYIFLGTTHFWRATYEEKVEDYSINVHFIKRILIDYKDKINKEVIPYLNSINDYIKMDKHDLFNILECLLEMFLIYLRYRFQNDLHIKLILSKKVKIKDIIRTWSKLYYLGMIVDVNRKDLSMFFTVVLGIKHIGSDNKDLIYNMEHVYLNCFLLKTGDKIKFSIGFDIVLDEYYNKVEVIYDNRNMILKRNRNKNVYDVIISDVIHFKDKKHLSDIIEYINNILDRYSDRNKLCIMFNRSSL